MKLAPNERQELTSATITQALGLILGCSALFALTSYAANPSWWATPGSGGTPSAVMSPEIVTNSGVVTTNYITNEYVVVTQGQLKQFTARAVNELNANLPGGAGTNLNSMVSNWAADYLTNGYNATNLKPSDYTVMNVGQLKYIGNKVWSQLVAGGYTNAAPPWLQQNTYTDNALANLGQLKEVFNFDLSQMLGITNLTASSSTPTQINLSWTLPANNPATSILVEQQNADGSFTTIATLSSSATSYTVTGLDPTQQYVYTVAIVDNAGTALAPPTAPTGTQPPPTPRYAVVDLGTNNFPVAIANNGVILGGAFAQLTAEWNPSGTGDEEGQFGSYGQEYAQQLNQRWVNGTWQTLQVPDATCFTATAMNRQGAVVGTAVMPDGIYYNYNVQNFQGVIWGANPATPLVQSSDIVMSFAAGETWWGEAPAIHYAARTYTLCTDSPTKADYAYGGCYATQAFQYFPAEAPADSDDRDGLNGPFSTSTSVTEFEDCYFPGVAYFVPVTGASVALGAANWLGQFYTPIGVDQNGNEMGADIFGNTYTNGPEDPLPDATAFTGVTEQPLLANANWLISKESAWSFNNNTNATDVIPGSAVPTLKYFPMTSAPSGTLSGGTALPSQMTAATALTDATNAADDVVIGNGYAWTLGGGTPVAINDSLVGIDNRYYTPPANATNASPSPVPDFQIAGGSDLWELTRDSTGRPFTPPNYAGTPYASLIGSTNWSQVSATGMNDSGAIVGTATKTSDSTSHGVMLCPVAAVQDSQNDHVIDMTDQPLTYVRFGLWDSAFSTINPPSPITGSLATPTVNDGNAESANLVGNDSRRFYIRVYDPSGNHSATTADTVTVDWFTQKSDGTDDDHPATDTITLTETGVNTGIFVSKALMLVADDVDNAQPVNTGLTGGADAALGAADHRLRRAALGDKMCYSYTPAATGSTKQTFSLPIFGGSEPVKNITVHFVETKTTTHNTISSTDITNMETQMSARWAVAGIQPNYVYNATTDVLDVTSITGLDLSNVDGNGLPGGQCYQIAQALRTKYGAYNASDPTIWVIVIGKFNATTGAGGLSFTDGLAADDLAKGYITSLSQMNPIMHCCFLAQLGGLNNPVAAPHELGHQLSDQVAADAGTDSNHYVGLNLGQDMMYWSANDVPQLVTDSKRLWDDSTHSDGVHTNQIDYMRQSPLCH